ncbi:hypothetical protein, conserved [Trypanosoma brucei gambiense DAL972]|uniref:TatD related DNase n=1 Tax=Trypanosoma brucei gambiense (strain MHOM/CI/86/DAL972) TaxID=679716 RepID=C9ZKG8_TRYB9|nr:hypothetical protein, conserved [Trypanosoma brucei gambiense DAL972]CBH09934.1 hypothetical protein, conserved [Trypanosoma brucei gambiense DAL972]|eukprot:XP_011772225.1 hypothetical protein, conserved [Trypanosoma brucei gambiense DAL972]
MGFVDRGGGREAKGSSLRHSKKNPGAPAARKASSVKQQPLARVAPVPPTFRDHVQHVDASVAILSRKFGTGYSEMLVRAAREGGVGAALTWCGNFEQQDALIELCRQHNAAASVLDGEEGCSKLYCLVGVHVNSVDRTHKQQQEKWMEGVVAWTRHQEVIGLLSGFSLTRDSGTHFAQECLLKELWRKAGELQLPIVLHLCPDERDGAVVTPEDIGANGNSENMLTDGNHTVDRAAELIAELMLDQADEGGCGKEHGATRKNPTAVVLHNGVGALSCSSAMRELVRKHVPKVPSEATTGAIGRGTPPIYVLATAEGVTSSNAPGIYRPSFVHSLRNYVSLSQLLIGTGSPWNTPQNIPDEYLRTMHNEPANYQYVALAVHNAISKDVLAESPEHQEFCATVRDNFLRVFFGSSPSGKQSPQQPCDARTEEAVGEKAADKPPKPPVHFDPSIKTSSDAVKSSPESMRYYLCLKCRRKLFHERALLTHPPDAARAHFNVRQAAAGRKNALKGKHQPAVGSCDSVCFLRVVDGAEGEWCVEDSDVVVHRLNATVSCGGCGSKLGTAADDCSCPCGCVIAGTTARLAATKVEAPIGRKAGGDLDELLLEAAREREQLLLERETAGHGCGSDSDDDGEGKRKVKEAKKNVKTNNRSNFTHFRNKNFAPKQHRGHHDGSNVANVGMKDDVDEVSDGDGDGDDERRVVEDTAAGRRARRKQNKKSNRHSVSETPSE